MRVVSLVPSWTETLLAAGVNVVGRTRYCLHGPGAAAIPVVGGTKDWDWPRVLALKPDLLLLDQEENPKFMAEQSEIPFHATHVRSVQGIPGTLQELAQVLKSAALLDLAREWGALGRARLAWQPGEPLPGLLEWGSAPVVRPPRQVLYMIWRSPWMAVSADTFIGSVLEHCGIALPKFAGKYPEVDLSSYSPSETLLLFSSEPYPFLRKKAELAAELGEFPYAFVDGESFSWFGVRSLRFLQSRA